MAQEARSARDPRPDRRLRPTRMLSRYTFFGRRRRNRRGTDPQASYYIDRPDSKPYLFALFGLMALILIDTFSTLFIISQGGGEANPLMRWFIERGPFWFIAIKFGSAAVGFLLLVVSYFYRVARYLTTLLFAAYACLVAYHFSLLTRILG